MSSSVECAVIHRNFVITRPLEQKWMESVQQYIQCFVM